jgi:hypothetical protein
MEKRGEGAARAGGGGRASCALGGGHRRCRGLHRPQGRGLRARRGAGGPLPAAAAREGEGTTPGDRVRGRDPPPGRERGEGEERGAAQGTQKQRTSWATMEDGRTGEDDLAGAERKITNW